MHSERIKYLAEYARINGRSQTNTFNNDLNHFAKTKFSHLEKWEKFARSMAAAIENMPVCVLPEDTIIGRVYHSNPVKVEDPDPDLNYISAHYQHHLYDSYKRLCAEIPDYPDLTKYRLCGRTGVGHIAWNWNMMLRLGTEGMRGLYFDAMSRTEDKRAHEFYNGVLIMLDSLDNWNEKHITELVRLNKNEEEKICRTVPKYPAETFREAVQSFFMQYIVVMKENPYGGNSPGRLDYYLWPYLERDIAKNRCTLAEAREIIDELFIRIDERIHDRDGWVEAIVVGGSHTNGTSAVNPLSYIMIESIMELNLTHPSVYVRLPHFVPPEFLSLCARYFIDGSNRTQILSDDNIIRALQRTGVPYRDAVEYYCGGCMEIGIAGMTSDFLFNGWQNILKIAELFTTGGECLKTRTKLSLIKSEGLVSYNDFEGFYTDFISEVTRMYSIFFKAQEYYSEESDYSRPSYLISSMIGDCLERGRNMHGGGARYHDYGSSPVGVPNTADYLFAVKKAVFEEKICSAEELITAMRANYEGYETLRRRLSAIPKYGQDNKEADEFAARLFADISKIYTSYKTRFGGRGKMVVLTFVYAPVAGEIMGATADGGYAGKFVAQSVTPQSSSMSKGITAAINSCTALPFELFNGGASTMWDIDSSWANEDIVTALLLTFFEKGGQIFQGNTTNIEDLVEAMQNPGEFYGLIVRVGGYSARFVNLSRSLQNDIINRIRHKN